MRAMKEPWSPLRGAETQVYNPLRTPNAGADAKLLPQTKEDWMLLYDLDEKGAEIILKRQQEISSGDPLARDMARRALQAYAHQLTRELRKNKNKHRDLKAEIGGIRRRNVDAMATLGRLFKWSEQVPRPLRLERCQETRLSELIGELKLAEPGTPLCTVENDGGVPSTIHALRHAQILLIEHDWAGAMAKADLDADFQLPYDVTVFEMVMGERHLIAQVDLFQGSPKICLFVSSNDGWLRTQVAWWRNGRWESGPEGRHQDVAEFEEIVLYVGAQVRACCIALDAEVATATAVRAPHRSNSARDATVRKPYHVVSLARRERAVRLSDPGATGRHPRLHFRRGHWRHFENHKTWIKWMLVGDPDLGFVDKHYKL